MGSVLPHERAMLEASLVVAQAEALYLGREVGEAAGPNCDWHDNGGLDAALSDKLLPEQLVYILKDIIGEVSQSDMASYPAALDPSIGLGSIVTVETRGFTSKIALVGQRVVGNQTILDIWDEQFAPDTPEPDDELTLLTPTVSALAGSLLYASNGQVTRYEVKNPDTKKVVEHEATVVGLDQSWMAVYLGDMTIKTLVPLLSAHSNKGAKVLLKDQGYDVNVE